jgi:hypothetical protein
VQLSADLSHPAPARKFHVVTLTLGSALLASLARGQWFFGDEWDPIAQRSLTDDAAKSLLAPHNEHWSTAALLVYRAHLEVFGLRTYAPLMALFIGVCALTAHLMWRVCLKVGSDPYVAAIVALAFLCYGPAAEDAMFAWNLTFVGALACGFATLVQIRADRPLGWRALGWTWGLGLLGIMLSGVALTMLAVVFACCWWSHGLRRALLAIAVPAAAYAIWTLGWGRSGQSLLSTAGLRTVPSEVTTGLTATIGHLVRLPHAGTLALLGLGAWVAVTWRNWVPTRGWALACALGAVMFHGIVALRRHSPLLPGPTTGRYLWVSFAFLVPLVSLAVTQIVRRGTPVAACAATLGTVLLAIQVGPLGDAAREARAIKQAERRRVIAAADLIRSDEPLVARTILTTSAFERSLTVDVITQLDRAGMLPQGPIDASDRLGARAELQVALEPGRVDPAEPAVSLVGGFDVELVEHRDGCIVVTATGMDPRIVLRASPKTPSAAQLTARFQTPPTLTVIDGRTRSPSREILLLAEGPYRLRLAAAPIDVELRAGRAALTLCRVQLAPSLLDG